MQLFELGRFFERKLKRGEVAACISHYNVWKYIKENNFKYSLILEDDAIFDLDIFLIFFR